MKLLCTGDWHIDNNRPERRVDDYWETVQHKIKFIVSLANNQGCKAILQPGDFFNTHRANDLLKRWVIKLLRWNQVHIITVFGQHDLRYHSSNKDNTPLAVLHAAEVIDIPSNKPLSPSINIEGASWYEDIPEPDKKYEINILLIHRMIIKNKKLWDGQEDATFGNILLKTSGFDLIISGDNHNHFTISTKSNKHLVNCGSLLRTKIDQVDHTPLVYIYDTNNRSITPYEIPHEPFNKVFDMDKYDNEKQEDEKLNAFVDRLDGDVELEGLDFIKNMDSYVLAQDNIDDITLDIIEEVMA